MKLRELHHLIQHIVCSAEGYLLQTPGSCVHLIPTSAKASSETFVMCHKCKHIYAYPNAYPLSKRPALKMPGQAVQYFQDSNRTHINVVRIVCLLSRISGFGGSETTG